MYTIPTIKLTNNATNDIFEYNIIYIIRKYFYITHFHNLTTNCWNYDSDSETVSVEAAESVEEVESSEAVEYAEAVESSEAVESAEASRNDNLLSVLRPDFFDKPCFNVLGADGDLLLNVNELTIPSVCSLLYSYFLRENGRWVKIRNSLPLRNSVPVNDSSYFKFLNAPIVGII